MHVLALVLLAVVLSVMAWFLVHCAPPLIARMLPQTLTFAIGALMFVMGVSRAFTSARVAQDAEGILYAMVQMYVGLWFMLAPSAGMRGSDEDQRFLRRLFGMIGIVMTAIIASLYVDSRQAIAFLQLVMITGGFWVTINYLRLTDRGG